MKKIISYLFLVLFVIPGEAMALKAPPYPIIQLSNNNNADQYPSINNRGQIAWESLHPTNPALHQVFLHNGTNTVNLGFGFTAKINKNGDVIWEGVNSQVYLYDYASQITRQISQNTTNVFPPDIAFNSRQEVVWFEYVPPSTITLFRYNGTINQIASFSNNNSIADLAINDNGYIVWSMGIGNVSNIYLYDPITQTVNNITNSANLFHTSPNINNNGDIAWMGGVGSYAGNNSYEIYLYDGRTRTIRQVTNDLVSDQFHGKHGLNEWGDIAWSKHGATHEIYYYNKSTQTATRITNNNYINRFPELSDNGYIMWLGYPPPTFVARIFLYEGAQIHQITINNNLDNASPRISEHYLTWMGYDGNDWEILKVISKPPDDIRACQVGLPCP